MQRSTGTNNSNSSAASQAAACAVCKYRRRKCSPNCLLAPFFPANHHKDFLNTRKLFGVRNITKLIENLDPNLRAIAMKSIVYEANTRANTPVGGCYSIILDLQRQIDRNQAELDLVLQQLAICKAEVPATTTTQQQHSGQEQMVQVVEDDQGLEGFNMYDGMPVHDPHCQQDESSVFKGNYGGLSFLSSVYNVFDYSFVKVEPDASVVPMIYKRALLDVGEDIKPLLDVFDDKGAGAFPFDSKVSIHCSEKLVSKKEVGSFQHDPKHDLKDAASLFTLTNGKG
ncbi:hypothetical protein REPUB_Repub03eG0039900 [Reevesia pubescens]